MSTRAQCERAGAQENPTRLERGALGNSVAVEAGAGARQSLTMDFYWYFDKFQGAVARLASDMVDTICQHMLGS